MSQLSQEIIELYEACVQLGTIVASEEDQKLKTSYEILLNALFERASDLEASTNHWLFKFVPKLRRKQWREHFDEIKRLWENYKRDSELSRIQREAKPHSAEITIGESIVNKAVLNRMLDELARPPPERVPEMFLGGSETQGDAVLADIRNSLELSGRKLSTDTTDTFGNKQAS